MMMLVEALIRPQRIDAVKQALTDIGVKGMTVTVVQGYGHERGLTHQYRGAEYIINFVQKLKVEVVVLEREARVVANAIRDAARTGEVGDGMIFLIPVPEAVRIRTGEEGRDAVE